MRDFTKYIKESPSFRAYSGANGLKKGILIDNAPYLLKIERLKKGEKRYSNAMLSEYLVSKIFSLFLPTQEVLLGFVNMGGVRKSCVACRDFKEENEYLYEFMSVKNCVLHDGLGCGSSTELIELLRAIDEQDFTSKKELKKRFWDMFILDAYLANFDRHNGNWGILVNDKTKKTRLAPVYDCGSCLFPGGSDDDLKSFLNDENELKKRIFVFPNSSIKENGKKINYHDFLNDLKDKDALKSLKDLVPKIEAKNLEIENIINDLKISDIRKSFYKMILKMRFESILKPAFEKIKA